MGNKGDFSDCERDMVVGLSVLEPADLICWDFAAQP